MATHDASVRLDLNNPVFQAQLFGLQKPERNAAIDTLRKIRLLTWDQLYRDNGLKWEKIISVKPPTGIDAIYSLRITQSRRCTAYRDGDFMRLLTVAPDHDSTYGQKEKSLAGQPRVGGRSSQPIQHQTVDRQWLLAVQEVTGPGHFLVCVFT